MQRLVDAYRILRRRADTVVELFAMERVPFNRPLKNHAGTITIHCDQHVADAQIAEQASVEAQARHSDLPVYRKIAAAWPEPARLRHHALDT
jgi:hypothetical protein